VKNPATCTHPLAPAADRVPAAHGVQAVAPAAEEVLAGQMLQSWLEPKVPAGQALTTRKPLPEDQPLE
jgi:hypothetical protein